MASGTPIDRATLSRRAYLVLRSRILARRLPAGTKLVVRELAEDLELSSTPIKEALAALEREGLVELRPHRGYTVPHLEPADIVEIYALREVLEGLAARLAAARPSRGRFVSRMRELLADQRASAEDGDMERYGDLDLQFHRVLWEAADNQRLLQAAESLIGQVRLLISTSAELEGRLEATRAEQDAILRAVEDGSPERADDAMRRHVRLAGQALLQHLEEEAGITARLTREG